MTGLSADHLGVLFSPRSARREFPFIRRWRLGYRRTAGKVEWDNVAIGFEFGLNPPDHWTKVHGAGENAWSSSGREEEYRTPWSIRLRDIAQSPAVALENKSIDV